MDSQIDQTSNLTITDLKTSIKVLKSYVIF